MRANVKKFLPVLRRQIKEHGYAKIRQCLVTGDTKFLSGKDRREALFILDVEEHFNPRPFKVVEDLNAIFEFRPRQCGKTAEHDFKQEYMGTFDIKGD